MSHSPNYSNYTIDELYDALHNIDKELYPERASLIRGEIEKRDIVDSNSEDIKNIDLSNLNSEIDTDFNIEDLHWKLIIKYFFIIIITSMILSFPFGFLQGFLNSIGRTLPEWSKSIQILFQYLGVITVFAYFTFKYQKDTFLHTITIAIICWFISIPINLYLEEMPLKQAIAGITFWLITCGLGNGIGKLIFKYRSKLNKENNKSN